MKVPLEMMLLERKHELKALGLSQQSRHLLCHGMAGVEGVSLATSKTVAWAFSSATSKTVAWACSTEGMAGVEGVSLAGAPT
ncbi:hypothetical protein U1Q18_010349 [Sarracenia purpurea var. burkii]